VVLDSTAGLPVQTPLGEARESPRAILELARIERSGRETRRVREQLLHADDVLPVRRELRDDVRDTLVDRQLAFLDQQPGSRRGDRLRAREHAEQRVVGVGRPSPSTLDAAVTAQRGDSPVARDRDLNRRQQSVADLALCSVEQRIELARIDTHVFGRARNQA
jgi:hypothetical protein